MLKFYILIYILKTAEILFKGSNFLTKILKMKSIIVLIFKRENTSKINYLILIIQIILIIYYIIFIPIFLKIINLNGVLNKISY